MPASLVESLGLDALLSLSQSQEYHGSTTDTEAGV
jgi:hypothetical protein